MSTNDVLSKLKAEIEKRKNICNGVYERDSDTYYQGKAVAYQETLSLIDSLQQEQPCDTCTNDKGCVTCKDGELWEGKPVENLKEEIKRLRWLVSDHNYYLDNSEQVIGYELALNDIEKFLDTSKEQSSEELDAEIEMVWDSFNKHLAEYDGESEDVVWLNRFSFEDIANYFYELGQQAKKEE